MSQYALADLTINDDGTVKIKDNSGTSNALWVQVNGMITWHYYDVPGGYFVSYAGNAVDGRITGLMFTTLGSSPVNHGDFYAEQHGIKITENPEVNTTGNKIKQ